MRFSASLDAAVVILVLSVGVGAYVDVRNDQMHTRHLEVNTGLERMVRLHQELTHMLMQAVLERNTLRTASHPSVTATLEATIRSVAELTQNQSLSNEMSDLAADRAQLRVIEEQALALMREDRWDEARAMLFDDGYVRARKVYEINSDTVIGALTGELATMAERFNRIRMTALGVRLVALSLLLWVGAMFSRRLRAELAEQRRLRRELAGSNQVLEQKVLTRTAELEEANRQLEVLSATDGLTGLANRRKFNAVWDAEWQRAQRHGLPLALAMVDVDHFKAYNDHYGHQAGDECLQQIARILERSVQRTGELAARYGGEEFVLILPGQSALHAQAMAERIRATVQAQGLTHAHSSVAQVVTLSIGVAACQPGLGESPEAVIRRADMAMYQAKQQGRNRVVTAA